MQGRNRRSVSVICPAKWHLPEAMFAPAPPSYPCVSFDPCPQPPQRNAGIYFVRHGPGSFEVTEPHATTWMQSPVESARYPKKPTPVSSGRAEEVRMGPDAPRSDLLSFRDGVRRGPGQAGRPSNFRVCRPLSHNHQAAFLDCKRVVLDNGATGNAESRISTHPEGSRRPRADRNCTTRNKSS